MHSAAVRPIPGAGGRVVEACLGALVYAPLALLSLVLQRPKRAETFLDRRGASWSAQSLASGTGGGGSAEGAASAPWVSEVPSVPWPPGCPKPRA